MTAEEIKDILAEHALWLADMGGKRANLNRASLSYANLSYASLSGADLSGADLSDASLSGADLSGADLSDANLSGADLSGASLNRASLSGADLRGADLRGADLRCFGDMTYVKTMQVDRWAIGYTSEHLQIGCQRHEIEKWRKWDADAGRKWIAQMDGKVLEWAERHLALVLQIIDASPAKPTMEEQA